MGLLLLSFLLALLGVVLPPCSCDSLVQVQILHRHCDRTPSEHNLIPSCPIDLLSRLNLSTGILTPLGEYQCYQLGEFLRRRYLEDSSETPILGIDKRYNPREYTFRSSGVKRCLRSAWSVTKGLFPLGHRIDLPPFGYALPNASQTVPITQLEVDNDRIFLEYDNCPVIELHLAEFLASPAGQALLEKFKPYFEVLREASGLKSFTMPDIDWLEDVSACLKDHRLLCPEMSEVRDLLETIAAEGRSVQFNRTFVGKLAGGALLEAVVSEMTSAVTKRASDGSHKKMGFYSGHDTTVTIGLYAMLLTEDYPEFFYQPPWGSAVIWELWKKSETGKGDGSDQYYVRVAYRIGWDGPLIEGLKMRSLGCGDRSDCPLEVFRKNLQEKSFVSASDWCQDCVNVQAEQCLKFEVQRLREKLRGLRRYD